MQKLQTTYWLEPAGSHGVWGLDDYQFLCFVFGAAQLVNHPSILPSSIHDEELLRLEAEDYMYLKAIAFIRKVRPTKGKRGCGWVD
jgi:serine/threonine-protein phosphatase 2A activator